MTDDLKVTKKVQDAIALMDLHENASPVYHFVKRSVDIICSLMAIIVLSPLMLIITLCIRFESDGSAMFKQKRVGEGGKIFTLYKFRSMYKDAEQRLNELKKNNQVKGNMFKMKDDPRITRVGKFIRKTSLDELPQLFNIFKGDMTLVGPRPPLISEVLSYEPWHCLRLSIVPGLSGLWQTSGRNSLSFDHMVRLDLHYIKIRTLTFDTMVILKTFKVFLFDDTAF